MAGEIFQIYTVQITGGCLCENLPLSFHDLIIRPYVKQPPHEFAQKIFSPMKSFFKRKKSSHTFGGRRHYALSSYLLPFLKASFLTSVVQTMWACYAARCLYSTVPSGRKGALFFLRGQMYTSESTFINKLNTLSIIILVCLGNT